ncbi:MAG: 16S rRNA (uracil(1498)-N(3))-methyltransferase [Lachnospiraceae bacterium]|nr:16S rRNA (uracil(1498)-N(3))-methyltransferase [Lachnospiraceae bacterium]
MAQIFCDPGEKREDGTLLLSGENFHHIIQVLRLRRGEEFSVYFAGSTTEHRYGIERIGSEDAECRLRFSKEADVELPCYITVLQGLPKADKLETVIQKSVELGASRIVPVVCSRSIVRLDERKADSRTKRWSKIAESAAEQSRRAILPEVCLPHSVEEATELCRGAEVKLIAYELAGEQGASMDGTRQLIRGIRPGTEVCIFVGPEGGFTEDEVAVAKSAGFLPVTLGRRILRTETAAMTVLSWLVLELER